MEKHENSFCSIIVIITFGSSSRWQFVVWQLMHSLADFFVKAIWLAMALLSMRTARKFLVNLLETVFHYKHLMILNKTIKFLGGWRTTNIYYLCSEKSNMNIWLHASILVIISKALNLKTQSRCVEWVGHKIYLSK